MSTNRRIDIEGSLVETEGHFDALENVADLRPLMRGEDSQRRRDTEVQRIDTPGLFATGYSSSHAELALNRSWIMRIADQGKKFFPLRNWGLSRPFYKRRFWYRNPSTLWLLGMLGVLGLGVITYLVLVIFGSN